LLYDSLFNACFPRIMFVCQLNAFFAFIAMPALLSTGMMSVFLANQFHRKMDKLLWDNVS
ncbi:MAG: hypothetical protein LBJ01_07330, partial [Tannerella sp.]|nr:hypothetical protein [Tannerella sp.]